MMNENYLFKSPTHAANLNEMRMGGKLCDVTIKVEDKEFRVHKVVLAANLKYFESVFLKSFQESKQEVIFLKDVDESNLEAFINFAYTGEILLTKNNALSLLMVADYLDVDAIKNACIDFLGMYLPASDAFRAYNFANTIYCLPLKNIAKLIIQTNFGDCSQTIEYLDLQFEILIDLLVDVKFDNVESRRVLFEGIIRWLMHDPKERRTHVNDLLRSIAVAELSAGYLMYYLGSLADRSDDADFGIVKDIMSHYYRNIKIGHVEQLSNCSAKVLLLLDDYDGERFFHFYDFAEMRWSTLQRVLSRHGHIYNFDTVFCDRVYFFGHQSEEFHLEVFDPVTRQSITLPSSNAVLRVWHWPCLCSCEKFVYLCGGKIGRNPTNQVSKYDPQTSSFETMTPLRRKRYCSAAIFYQERLHVLGGHSTQGLLSSVERYDPDTKQWIDFPPMIKERFKHAAVALDGKLYVCGGVNTAQVEVYEPATNSWRQVASMNKERKQFILVTRNRKLWAIGGDEDKTVEVYDPSKDQWQVDDEMSPGLLMQHPAGGLISASCVTDIKSYVNA